MKHLWTIPVTGMSLGAVVAVIGAFVPDAKRGTDLMITGGVVAAGSLFVAFMIVMLTD